MVHYGEKGERPPWPRSSSFTSPATQTVEPFGHGSRMDRITFKQLKEISRENNETTVFWCWKGFCDDYLSCVSLLNRGEAGDNSLVLSIGMETSVGKGAHNWARECSDNNVQQCFLTSGKRLWRRRQKIYPKCRCLCTKLPRHIQDGNLSIWRMSKLI